MKRRILLSFALSALAALPLRAADPVLPFSEVRAGMKGVGKTVFQGTRVETFEVEILGTVPDIGPDQDLILGRLTGGPLERTGVLSGMSGSPVYVDGKLIGAVAYSWGFSREAIAGITPIEEMLRVAERRPVRRAASAGGLLRDDLARLRRPEEWASFFSDGLLRLSPAGGASARGVPISVGGFGPRGFAAVAPSLVRAGFLPLQGGGAGRSPLPSPPLEPGSAVGVKLIRGDLDMTATGTVTWVEGDRVLAFGHPLFSLGSVDLPLTGARVEALLPSLEQSVKIATPLAESGAFLQDRSAGISGRLGAKPRMIPVRLRFAGPDGPATDYAFDLADDPLLAPLLLYVSVNGVLASRERTVGSLTLGVGEGSVIRLEGRDEVALDNLFSGATAADYATGLSAYILHLVMNNEWAEARVTGVNLLLQYEERPRTVEVRRVTLDRARVRPGESVRASIVVRPWRGPDQVLEREIAIPPETPPGRLVLHVGNGLGISRAEGDDDAIHPRDLGQLIRLINSLRRNDRIHIVALGEDSGAFLEGARLPNLPPSALGLLSRPRTQGGLRPVIRRAVLEEQIPADGMVEGLARASLDVEAP